MKYLQQTTTLNQNETEYKCIRLQKYDNNTYKSTNKYYINGKLVTKHERFMCEDKIDNSIDTVFTEKEW